MCLYTDDYLFVIIVIDWIQKHFNLMPSSKNKWLHEQI